MPRHQTGLSRGQVLRGGRREDDLAAADYAAGWLAVNDKPTEDLVYLGSSAYSALYIGTETRNVYKTIKRTGDWFRFAFMSAAES
jgi:hypothetical protein